MQNLVRTAAWIEEVETHACLWYSMETGALMHIILLPSSGAISIQLYITAGTQRFIPRNTPLMQPLGVIFMF